MRLINSDGQITDARVIAQDGGNAASASVGNSVFMLPLLVALAGLSLLVSGLALGIGWWSTSSYSRDYKELERENRLLQLKVDEFRIALMNANIDPNPHLDGEQK
jgi:hypothetical protein